MALTFASLTLCSKGAQWRSGDLFIAGAGTKTGRWCLLSSPGCRTNERITLVIDPQAVPIQVLWAVSIPMHVAAAREASVARVLRRNATRADGGPELAALGVM